jgi:TonB family protein
MPDRLVIRVKLPSRDAQPQPPTRRRVRRGALLLILGAVAVVLAVIATLMLRTERTPAPAVTRAPAPVPAPREVAPVVQPQPVVPEVQKQPAVAPNSATNEVVPDVPLSARQTIRGTIRVSVRVIVAKDGTVVAATADEPGPSRYFERVSLEAARKWTFAPANREQRVVLVRFYFKRSGTTARATFP